MCAGAVNITYEVIRGSLQDLSQVEGALAEPGQDFVSGTGSVILQDGQTSVAIPVTILEVRAVNMINNYFLFSFKRKIQIFLFFNLRLIVYMCYIKLFFSIGCIRMTSQSYRSSSWST